VTRLLARLGFVPAKHILVYWDGYKFTAGPACISRTGSVLNQRSTLQDLAGIRRVPGY
jgi:hypothetical protein